MIPSVAFTAENTAKNAVDNKRGLAVLLGATGVVTGGAALTAGIVVNRRDRAKFARERNLYEAEHEVAKSLEKAELEIKA